jgi:hypothetical protein
MKERDWTKSVLSKSLIWICAPLAIVCACSRYTPSYGEARRGWGCQDEYVSLINLVATPERYDGKYVSVLGYVSLEFEGSAIYLDREDMRRCLTKNAIWLNVELGTNIPREELYRRFHGKCCLVEGRFNAQDKGHLGLFSGGLDVTFITVSGRCHR